MKKRRNRASTCARPSSLQFERLEDRLALAVTSIIPASVISGSSDTGNDSSAGGSVSADGRYTVYSSESTNLVVGQTDTADTSERVPVRQ